MNDQDSSGSSLFVFVCCRRIFAYRKRKITLREKGDSDGDMKGNDKKGVITGGREILETRILLCLSIQSFQTCLCMFHLYQQLRFAHLLLLSSLQSETALDFVQYRIQISRTKSETKTKTKTMIYLASDPFFQTFLKSGAQNLSDGTSGNVGGNKATSTGFKATVQATSA